MSVSTKFVPRLQQSGPRFWKWQNKIGTDQLQNNSFSTSASLEAAGPRWWRWQNKNPTTVNANGFSTSQSVGWMVEPQNMGVMISSSSGRVPSLHKIDEEFSEGLPSENSSVHQEWRMHPGCQMSWHSRQTCGGQVFMEKPSILIHQSKELRCLRNKIHTQLMITYTMAAILWIITNFTTTSLKGSVSSHVSCVAFILLHYFHLTSFFWMFVEGLYLYVLVVQTFQTQTENIKLRVYTAIGWGLPLLVVIGWSIVKWQTFRPPSVSETTVLSSDIELVHSMSCGFINAENYYDWIYKGPAILILFVNVVFLLRIMWVLITKLRSTTNPETKQSRKAAKAFLVLVPLLGITYIFTLAGPRKLSAFIYFRASLISTQGFLVALFYCFLNGEVKRAVRHRWNRSNCCASLRSCACCCGRCFWGPDGRRRHLQQVHEWSSRSRNESIRFQHTPASHPYRKRESDGSETTMTSVYGGGSTAGANGAQPLHLLPQGASASTKTPKLLTLQANSLLNQESAYNMNRRNNYA